MDLLSSIAFAIIAVIGLLSIIFIDKMRKWLRYCIFFLGLIAVLCILFNEIVIDKKYQSEKKISQSLAIDKKNIQEHNKAIQDTLYSAIQSDDKLNNNQNNIIITSIKSVFGEDSLVLENGYINKLSKRNFLKIYIKNIDNYNNSTNYWICLSDKNNIWPLVNLYGKKEIKSISIPSDFKKGYLNLIEALNENINNDFFEIKLSTVSQKLLRSDKIKFIIKTEIIIN